MLNITQHLLAKAAEEGAEIAQAAIKCQIFGLHEVNAEKPSDPTNVQKLVAEMNDLLGVASFLEQENIIPPNWIDFAAIQAKKAKLAKRMEHAARIGELDRGDDE